MKQRLCLTTITVLFTLAAFGQTRVKASAISGMPDAIYASNYYCVLVDVLVTDSSGTEILQSSAYAYIKKDRTAADESFYKEVAAKSVNEHCPATMYHGEIFQTEKGANHCFADLLNSNEEVYPLYLLERNKVLRQLKKRDGH